MNDTKETIRSRYIKSRLTRHPKCIETLENGIRLELEHDDWGKYIRVLDKNDYTIDGCLVVDEKNLKTEIDILIAKYK